MPKSFTFVYAHNMTQTKNRIVSLGQRQPNDKLLIQRKKLVKNMNRFAEGEFQYEDRNKFITTVTFSFSVSM